jgi:hypothetical protein
VSERSERSERTAEVGAPALAVAPPQTSAWQIGAAYYDQRDLYTQDSRIDAAGYAVGPSVHPEEGSYAYHREPHVLPHVVPSGAAGSDLYQREAWPWLNYFGPDKDPYFAFLRRRAPGLWERTKNAMRNARSRVAALAHGDPWRVVDRRIRRQVRLALVTEPDLDASDIETTVRWGVVRLDGMVSDRRSRKVAERVASEVSGVRMVQNRLTLRKDDPRAPTAVFVMPVAAL